MFEYNIYIDIYIYAYVYQSIIPTYLTPYYSIHLKATILITTPTPGKIYGSIILRQRSQKNERAPTLPTTKNHTTISYRRQERTGEKKKTITIKGKKHVYDIPTRMIMTTLYHYIFHPMN